jgi:toxin ParE1/3/4
LRPTQLIYSQKADRELKSLERYISERESAEIAAAYIERIQLRCEKLLTAPLQGTRRDHVRPNLRTTGFEKRATIVFRVTRTTVRILSIAYGGRRYESGL